MPSKPPPSVADPHATDPAATTPPQGAGRPAVSLAELGIAGISRRRVGWVVVALVAVWVVVSFAGQAAAATHAADRAVQEQATNDALTARVAALGDELSLVQTQRWILQQARAYALGTQAERPFAIAPDAPSLAPDAPGSSARRLGSTPERRSALDSWLDALFGSGNSAGN